MVILSFIICWEIYNISGVCGEFWVIEGIMWGMEENLSGCRFFRLGILRDKIRVFSFCLGLGLEGVFRIFLLLGSDCFVRGCLFFFVCMCIFVFYIWVLLRVCVFI